MPPSGVTTGWRPRAPASTSMSLAPSRATRTSRSGVQERLDILKKYDLKVWAISNHLKGQAVCDDPIDFRHQAIVGSRVWGDGEAEGVRRRAAEEMKLTAKAARRLGVDMVVGFTGSKIWPYVALFPPVGADVIEAGFQDFAGRGTPSSTSSTARGCASPTKCTRARSPMITGRACAPSRRSSTERRSASTGNPRT